MLRLRVYKPCVVLCPLQGFLGGDLDPLRKQLPAANYDKTDTVLVEYLTKPRKVTKDCCNELRTLVGRIQVVSPRRGP